MTTLFDLTGEALRLQRQIDDAATDLFSDDPEVVAAATATLESLICAETDNRKEVERKADAWCWVIDQLRARSDARKARAIALDGLAADDKQQAETLQDRLIQALQKVDPDSAKWELPEHKITSRRSQAVELTAEIIDLPEEFQRVKTTVSADKTAIAAALKQGQQIEGAALVERRSWKIA
jgi:uncharacterized protein involved in exopolysaccharide biosynthesis